MTELSAAIKSLSESTLNLATCTTHSIIRATLPENLTYAICEQQRRRSACASAQSDQAFVVRAIWSAFLLFAQADLRLCCSRRLISVFVVRAVWSAPLLFAQADLRLCCSCRLICAFCCSRSLISAFVVHCLNSIILILSKSKISRP